MNRASEPTVARGAPAVGVTLGVAAALGVVAAWAGRGGEGPHGGLGLPETGTFTTYALPVTRVLVDLSAVAVVGSLALVVLLLPRRGAPERWPLRVAVVGAAVWWAMAWATVPLTLSELFAHPVSEVLTPRHLFDIAPKLPFVAAWWASGLAAAAVVVIGLRGRSHRAAAAALGAALVGIGAIAASGHSATGWTPELAADSLVLHMVAAALWAGGLLAVLIHVHRRGPSPDAVVAVERLSTLALVCFLAITATGIANLVTRVPLDELIAGDYGRLVLGKAAGLVALGAFGLVQRRRAVAAMRAGAARVLLILGAGELVLLGGTVGLAVALSRTAPPLVPTDEVADNTAIYALGWTLPTSPSPAALAAWWRPDALAIGLAAVAVATYLVGVARTQAWPPWRTAAWVVGWALVVLSTSGGLARYAPAVFSVFVLQYVLLGVVVPALLVIAAPGALWRSLRPGVTEAWRPGPAPAVAVFLGVACVVATGVAAPLLAVPAARHLLQAAFVGAGLLLFGSLARAGSSGLRCVAAIAAAELHVLLAVGLAVFGAPAATAWFGDIRPPWPLDILADQTGTAPALWTLAQLPLLAAVLFTAVAAHRR